MIVGVASILDAYVVHALTNPSAIMRADFPGLTFRPSMGGGSDGIGGMGVTDGLFAFAELEGEPRSVGDFAIDGSGRPVYETSAGAVAVRVTDTGNGRVRRGNLAGRYAQATRRALFTGPWRSFVDHDSGRTLSLNHFELTGDSSIIHRPAGAETPAYYLAVTRYRGTARPTD